MPAGGRPYSLELAWPSGSPRMRDRRRPQQNGDPPARGSPAFQPFRFCEAHSLNGVSTPYSVLIA